jgi:hypothetical protein
VVRDDGVEVPVVGDVADDKAAPPPPLHAASRPATTATIAS